MVACGRCLTEMLRKDVGWCSCCNLPFHYREKEYIDCLDLHTDDGCDDHNEEERVR